MVQCATPPPIQLDAFSINHTISILSLSLFSINQIIEKNMAQNAPPPLQYN